MNDINVWQWFRNVGGYNRGLIYKNPFPGYLKVEKIIGANYARKILMLFRNVQNAALLNVIKTIQPDIIHTMETQKAGYLGSEAGHHFKKKWIHSTWGVDLHYFQNFTEHKDKLIRLFSKIDVLVSEGVRDIDIAKNLGYKGKWIVIPSVGGGFDFTLFDSVDSKIPPSSRKKILLKGYEGNERLASNALAALRSIKEKLGDYEVIIYSCGKNLRPIIDVILQKKEFSLKIVEHLKYSEILKLVAESRVSITNNLSDGVPNTMLEAMALGAFPIQSNTAITDGWIEGGKNGFLTIPTDVANIANAIVNTLNDDQLVDNAAIFNKILVRQKLDRNVISKQIDEVYHTALVSDLAEMVIS